MKLQQNQVWQVGDEYLRIVHLERLEVEYKRVPDLGALKGEHHHVSKKAFCRLIKEGRLLTQSEIDTAAGRSPREEGS